MTTIREFTATVKSHLFDEFTNGGFLDPTTQVQWPNQSFEFPKNVDFARVSVIFDDRQTQEMNNYPFKTAFGSVEISIYSRGKTSTEDHDDIVQSMLGSLDDYTFAGSKFEQTRIITIGRLDAFWVTRLSTLFAKYDS